MMWDVVWCVGTNLFCLFPVYLAYKKNLDEWLLYLTTAIASMFYHLHHHNHYLKPACDFMNYEAIKMVDLVLSDMSVYWITSCMTYKNIQNKMFFLFLPFNMYVVYLDLYHWRWILTGFWITTSLLYVFINIKNYNKKFLAWGMSCSILELMFYEFLSSRYPWYYNWIHGTHHIFGFLGIYFYMRLNEIEVLPTHKRVTSQDSLMLGL